MIEFASGCEWNDAHVAVVTWATDGVAPWQVVMLPADLR